MSAWIAAFVERYFNIAPARTVQAVHLAGVIGATLLFVIVSTVIVTFDDLFPGTSSAANLQIGDIARQDVNAPISLTYFSEELTRQRRQAAMDAVQPRYDPPDPGVARQQAQLTRQILDFIHNVRRDPFAMPMQRLDDIGHITALTLNEDLAQHILSVDDETWAAIDEEISLVLERVMRGSIRDTDLNTVQLQLPMQVSVRFSGLDADVIVAVVGDLVRANQFANPQATSDAQQAAAASVAPQQRSFERGQIVVRAGTRIEAADYEALNVLGLLRPADRRMQEFVRALIGTILTVVVVGLYVARFHSELFGANARMLIILACIFLLTLAGVRVVGVGSQIYIYPAAALALVFASLVTANFAIVTAGCLALLIGLMADNSLEVASLVAFGAAIGTLTLRRTEGFNHYFVAGSMIAITELAVVALFNLSVSVSALDASELGIRVLYSLINGVLSAAAALVGLYILTQLFNLPTSIKLLELSRPNQPLLQRLLREAPGTYQHSLQVANLGEQAAEAIGASAELVRVAALYHDIGKVLNPMFFVENQMDNVNAHMALNDPYRSADIIIGHVTEGDELARQHYLPARIRDFILEHHGTTQVAYFYRQAVQQSGDESAVSIEEFTYPGPRPQSRETGILMLADSCESTVRARRPATRQEVAEVVHQVVQTRLAESQLDDSGLTLHDLKVIQRVFIDMLQSLHHPRINYPTSSAPLPPALAPAPNDISVTAETRPAMPLPPTAASALAAALTAASNEERKNGEIVPPSSSEREAGRPQTATSETPIVILDDDDAPLPTVPPLRRTGEQRAVNGDKLDQILGETPESPEPKDQS